MKKYEVISYFTDLRDYDHAYNVGDEFPRQGVTVNEERIAELSGCNNKQRRPLIKAVEDLESQKPEKQETQNPDKNSESPAISENGEDHGTHEQMVAPKELENPEQNATPADSGEKKKYSKEDIAALKLAQIREIAGRLGFKISSTSKDGAVAEFMEKQG